MEIRSPLASRAQARAPLGSLALLALTLAGCPLLSAGDNGDGADSADAGGADTGVHPTWEPGFIALSDGTSCKVDDGPSTGSDPKQESPA